MMAVTDPGLCKRVALRYAALMFPLCFLCPYLDITTWNFAYTSSAVNAFMVRCGAKAAGGAACWRRAHAFVVRHLQLYGSWRFYQDANAKTARGLFFASIVHLPLLLSLLLIHKKVQTDFTRREHCVERMPVHCWSDGAFILFATSCSQTRKPKELKDETDREFLLDSTVAEPPPAHAPAAA
jgi:hypothetical protein